jgi:hypothetical protein
MRFFCVPILALALGSLALVSGCGGDVTAEPVRRDDADQDEHAHDGDQRIDLGRRRSGNTSAPGDGVGSSPTRTLLDAGPSSTGKADAGPDSACNLI